MFAVSLSLETDSLRITAGARDTPAGGSIRSHLNFTSSKNSKTNIPKAQFSHSMVSFGYT
jgi:hypothetical protein